MIKVAELNDTVAVSGFCYMNEYGGTDISNYDRGEKEKHDPNQYDGLAIVKIVKAWEDDECGWRYHGKPLNPTLLEYLKKVNALGRPKNGDFTSELPREADMKIKKDAVTDEIIIFFSEFDIDWKTTDQNDGFINYKGE